MLCISLYKGLSACGVLVTPTTASLSFVERRARSYRYHPDECSDLHFSSQVRMLVDILFLFRSHNRNPGRHSAKPVNR